MIHGTSLHRLTARLVVIVRLAALVALVGAMAAPGTTANSVVLAAPLAQTSPTLGAARSFSVLAETAITNIPTSAISRDVGLSPAAGTNYAGLTTLEVGGTIYAVDSSGPAGLAGNNPGLLTTAINDMMTVFNGGTGTGIDQPCTTTYAGVQDLTLVSPLGPGVYCADAFLLTGNLTLSESGVWIFKSAATLTTSTGSSVTGGDPCNVWWRLVSDADIFPNSSIIGNILAGTSINLQSGARLNGRALAQAAVTLNANAISGPVCAAAPPGPGSTPSAPSDQCDTTPSGYIQYEIAQDVTALSSPGGSAATDSNGPIVLHAGEHWFGSPTPVLGGDGQYYIELVVACSHVFIPIGAAGNAPTTTAASAQATTSAPTSLPLTGYPPPNANPPDNRLLIVIAGGLLMLAAGGIRTFGRIRKPR
jgi:hypothetical protein